MTTAIIVGVITGLLSVSLGLKIDQWQCWVFILGVNVLFYMARDGNGKDTK